MGTAPASQGARTELWVREKAGSPGDLQNEAGFQEADGLSPSLLWRRATHPQDGWGGPAAALHWQRMLWASEPSILSLPVPRDVSPAEQTWLAGACKGLLSSALSPQAGPHAAGPRADARPHNSSAEKP